MKPTTIAEVLETCMERAVERNEVAGCSLMVLKNFEEKVYLETGYADLEKGRKITRESVFRMYSMSKPVTAAAVMRLVEDGYLDLYDFVGSYFDSFREQEYEGPDGTLQRVPEDRAMRIRDLLNMTSGLTYPEPNTKAGTGTGKLMDSGIRRLGTQNQMSTQEFCGRVGRCPLLFIPGSSWNYSVSADILGGVIEKITGMTFGDYLRESIFDPCEMEDTGFFVPQEKRDRLVTAYENADRKEGVALLPYLGNHLCIRNDGGENAFESGGAGLFSTIDDYRKFTQMLLNNGTALNGKRILRPGTVRYMTEGRLLEHQQRSFSQWIGLEGHTYGCLNRVLAEPEQAGLIGRRGEYGWDGWLGTYYLNDPQEKETIILMLNKRDYGQNRLTRQLRNIIGSVRA